VPKRDYTLNDFSGGINNVKDARDIAPNELAKATNVMLDQQGAIRTAGSMDDGYLVNNSVATNPGRGLYYFESDVTTNDVSYVGADVSFEEESATLESA